MSGPVRVAVLLLLAPAAAGQLPPEPFTEEASLRGLSYVSTQGVGEFGFGCGVAFADLDGDGDPDVVAIGAENGRVGVFENTSGFFADRSAGAGIPGLMRASGVTAADYDGDGDLDLYFSNWLSPNVLARNDGGFRFTDVTDVAEVGDDEGAGAGCAWADYDGDGWLDLYVANRTGSIGTLVSNRLFRNMGGFFLEVAAALGVDAGDEPSFQPVFLDYDRDGDPDLYLSNDKGYGGPWHNRLWRNDGGSFVQVTQASGTGVAMNSMGVAVGDFDDNGYSDLYCTNTHPGNALLMNEGDGTFTDASLTAGVGSFAVGWGAIFLDYDNDGFRELYVCNMDAPNRLYDHDGAWPARDDAPLLACDDAAMSFGSATADFDGDGDLDLLVHALGGATRLFVNHSGDARDWARFRVAGRGPNRFAIGARVDLLCGGVLRTASVHAGTSYKSQSELVVHFGLGSAALLDEIRVRWPDGTERALTNYRASRLWTLLPPERLGDADGDGDVDIADLEAFQECFTGSGPGRVAQGCEVMDLDGDGDVDEVDRFLLRDRVRASGPHAPGKL